MAELLSSDEESDSSDYEAVINKESTTPTIVVPRVAGWTTRRRQTVTAAPAVAAEKDEVAMESSWNSTGDNMLSVLSRSEQGGVTGSNKVEEISRSKLLQPKDATSKPVISAREMLLRFMPNASKLKRKEVSVSQQEAMTRQDKAPIVAATASEAMSNSERIARKYGLVPSGLKTSDAEVTRANPTTTSLVMATSRLHDAGGKLQPLQVQERKALIKDVNTTSTPTTRDSFWKTLETSDENEAKGSKGVQASPRQSYVSPFGRNGAEFTSARRQRNNTPVACAVNKEALYNDNDESTTSNRQRPSHIEAARITQQLSKEGQMEDADVWLSDAEDVELQQAQQASKAAATIRRASTGGQFGGSARKRKRPRSLSEDQEEVADELIMDRWPQLPPPDAMLGPLELKAQEGTRNLVVCPNINSYLFDYQREGAQFLFEAYDRQTGAILGDEMGLGKTIQVISLLAAILHKHGDHRDKEEWKERRKRQTEGGDTSTIVAPILIVVPASLVQNWESELHVWMYCNVTLLQSKPDERESRMNQVERGEFEIVVCSYDVLKIMLDRITNCEWDVIILDEMHCLKNPESQITKAVQALHCPRKLGLTGTLMQNNEKELHCLINTIAPGALGSWQDFRVFYADDIKYGRKKSAAREAVLRSRMKEKALRQILVPYYFRREKEINPRFQDIKKRDQIVFCELTPYQMAAYERILAMPEFELLRRGEEPCDCGRESKRKRKACCYQTPLDLHNGQRGLLWERFHSKKEVCKKCPNCMGLVCVAQLLKLSNHMELLKVNPHESEELQEYQADFAAVAFGSDLDAVGGVHQVTSFQELRKLGHTTCGKMAVLEKLLAVWTRKREKTLIFSRSTRMLDILQLFLVSKGLAYLRLDGNTRVDERLQLVQRFNSPESTIRVFLISTRAGGLGLNLPSATNVVIFDPSWNPAHDCQAQDRAYRIGQTKDVHVYRLITLGTIEEMMYVRQIYKQQLSDTTLKGVAAPRYFEGVQGDRRQQGELFGIKNLLCWKADGVLKDIQDAYVRDQNGIRTQQNQVEYKPIPTTAATGTTSSRGVKKAKTAGNDLLDDDMAEVAAEVTSNFVETEAVTDDTVVNTKDSDDGEHEWQASSQDDKSGEETEACLLQGARTMMHQAIVGEDEQGVDVFSETDDDEQDQDEHDRNEPAA